MKSKASSSWPAGGAACPLAGTEASRMRTAKPRPSARARVLTKTLGQVEDGRTGGPILGRPAVVNRNRATGGRVVADVREGVCKDALGDQVGLILGQKASCRAIPDEIL